MTVTALEAGAIAPIGHQEAMELAAPEATRLLDVVATLTDDDWSRPTDCEGWDVKALLSHVLGAMEANARPREFLRQFRVAAKAAKRSGRPMIDEMTASQVKDHVAVAPKEMARRLADVAPRAVRGRRRTPAPLRRLPIKPGDPFPGSWKLGYLIDTIMNRDSWMHRVDLTRALERELVVSAEHDGRIIADVVSEWARVHGQPFTLVLDGPAGGTYVQRAARDGGPAASDRASTYQLDAIEYCRILSGRSSGSGLLNQEVPF
jgi:uncharacterized protein (TIGR03083 family)